MRFQYEGNMKTWIVTLKPHARCLDWVHNQGAVAGIHIEPQMIEYTGPWTPQVFAVHEHALRFIANGGHRAIHTDDFVITEAEASAYDMNPPQAFKQAYDFENFNYRRDHLPPSGDPCQLELYPDLVAPASQTK